jgi:Ubiquitin-activating enzyme E1 FCCH domain
MAYVNSIINNFEFGEVSPLASARHDLRIGQSGVERCQNFIVQPQGPLQFRHGTRFVAHTRQNKFATYIPFQFNDEQSYLIEATDQFFRFYKDDAIIVESPKTVTGVTQANPAVVTSAAHGYSNGQDVFINGVVGMTQLNGRQFRVANVTVNTFELQDTFGTTINSTAFTAYASGGTAERIYEIATPYLEGDLEELQFAQNADTMYIAHQAYEPRKLTRTGHTAWTLGTYSRTADPFTAGNQWPRSVVFTSDGRLMFGGTPQRPETFWASRGPGTTTRYDDFTTGSSASDAVTFTLAPVSGQVDAIQWLTNTDKFICVGTFGTVRRVYGATEEEAITPTSITAKPVNTYGCALTLPVTIGTTVFYIERGRRRVRSFEYDYRIDGYVSVNRNLISSHLTENGIRQLVFQVASPNIMWAVRDDGALVGLTFEDKEDKAGWHRHYIGGDGKVIAVGVMPRPLKDEQLWLIVERTTASGATARTVEFFTDAVVFPERADFYTGAANGSADQERYLNALYEKQKLPAHLDMSLTYDGRDTGRSASASITPSATAGTITITASAAVFTASMVGRQIWKSYNSAGIGGGRATITGFTSSTQVTASVVVPFDSVTAMAAGTWFLTTTALSGLSHLEGRLISLVVDGAAHPAQTVVGGSVTINAPASVVHAGLLYRGIVVSMNLEFGGTTGPSQAKRRNVSKAKVRFLNSGGSAVGTNLYQAEKMQFRETGQLMDRPIPLFTGYRDQKFDDRWSDSKRLCILQDSPFPCTIQAIDIYGETTNE